ncbi:hypothetical protein KIW84_074401 [Lathyrus oleraceus]|uniref:Uncharacterized protein n=1 Tax=Pisum sativum TaxID=3888 RepID=A0A9D4VTS6_PEA|nr:hypothetical protein KIW84_074401 [Pisum sativum]
MISDVWVPIQDLQANMERIKQVFSDWNLKTVKGGSGQVRLGNFEEYIKLSRGVDVIPTFENKMDGEEDRNTRLYHLTIVIRRRRKFISLIKNNDGEWIEDPEDIQKLFESWYQNVYTTEVKVEDWMQTNTRFLNIEKNQKMKLTENLIVKEIKKTMFLMAPWKSPGPDGFPASFFQNS